MDQHKGFFNKVLDKRNIVLVLAAFTFIFGIISYINLPKQEYPIITMPIAVVTTVYPGATAEEMEELVTKKIENVVMEADGFDYCTSQSFESASVVMVTFSMGMSVDELQASNDNLRNKLEDIRQTDLPSGVVSLNYITEVGDTAGLILAFTGEGQSNAELTQRADELKTNLKNVPGVKRVDIDGEVKEEIDITVDPAKLNLLSLSLGEIAGIISYQNSIIPAGDIKFDNDKITVNTSGRLESIEEIGNIIVNISPESLAITRLSDIATVEKVPIEDAKIFQYNGRDAVLVTLYYEDGINIVAAGKEITKVVDAYKENLPTDVEVSTVVKLADDVNDSVNGFLESVLQSIIIVLIIVMLGMSFRNGIIVAVAIPISLVVPFIAMSIFNIDVQFISLAALIIALGMLVDNAVVVCDSIQVRIDNGEEKRLACTEGVKSVALPVLASTMTTVSIFIMFYLLPGTMKEFVFSMPTIVIAALLASYVVSMLVTPIMCYLLMKPSKPKKEGKTSILDKMGSVVGKLFNVAYMHKALTLSVAVVILVVSVSLLSTLKMQFIPKSEKTMVDISITTTNINDIRKSKEAVEKVVALISEQPETTYYLSTIGGGAPKYNFASMPSPDLVNRGNVMLGFDLKAGNRFEETALFVEYLQREIDSSIPSCNIVVRELGIVPETSNPVQVRITGDDFDNLNNTAMVIEQELEKIEGTTNIYSDRKYKTMNYYVDMKNTALNSYGLTKAEIQGELNAALMGRTASVYRQDTKEYNIVVKNDIKTTDELENLMVKSNATGAKHQIKQVADITLKADYSDIVRYNGKRCVTVSASPKAGYSSVEIQADLKKELDKMEFKDVYLKYEGETKDLNEALSGLIGGAAVGVMGIILTLFIQFYSFRKTAIVLCAIPFCFVGASLGLVIFKPGFSFFSVLGMLSLMGVVVNNAIVLVDYIDKERKDGMSIDEACKSAVTKRFRPVFLSTMTAVLGMLPLALGGSVLFRGMAIAFICGDSISMFFTLIVVPVVYGGWENKVEAKKLRKQTGE